MPATAPGCRLFCLSSEVELLKEHQGGKVRFLEAEFQGGCKRLKRIPHALVKDVYLWREHGELVARMGCNRSMFRRELG